MKNRLYFLEKIQSIVDHVQTIADAQKQFADLKRELDLFSCDQSEYLSIVSKLYEAMGDVALRNKKYVDTEKNYHEMVIAAKNLYDVDQEKYDYHFAYTCYKVANFYRESIQCASFSAHKRVFSESQQKIFSISEMHYKNAIACTMKHASEGVLQNVELQATCMNELAVLYSAAAQYEEAFSVGKDGIKLDEVIYQKTKDKARCFLYANRLNTMATITILLKDYNQAIHYLEKSIQVLREHEKDEPLTYGILLAKNNLALGNCFCQINKERKAEKFYHKGLKAMEEVNTKTKNGLIYDVITSYMIVGDYYRRIHQNENASLYYEWAMTHANQMLEKTQDQKYEKLLKYLQTQKGE